MDEKTIGIFGTIAVILLGVIGSLLAWCLGGKDLQGNRSEEHTSELQSQR